MASVFAAIPMSPRLTSQQAQENATFLVLESLSAVSAPFMIHLAFQMHSFYMVISLLLYFHFQGQCEVQPWELCLSALFCFDPAPPFPSPPAHQGRLADFCGFLFRVLFLWSCSLLTGTEPAGGTAPPNLPSTKEPTAPSSP